MWPRWKYNIIMKFLDTRKPCKWSLCIQRVATHLAVTYNPLAARGGYVTYVCVPAVQRRVRSAWSLSYFRVAGVSCLSRILCCLCTRVGRSLGGDARSSICRFRAASSTTTQLGRIVNIEKSVITVTSWKEATAFFKSKQLLLYAYWGRYTARYRW